MGKKLILRDCHIEIDDVDVSDHVSSVEVNLSKEEVDTTAFQVGTERQHGLPDDSFVVNLHQNFNPAEVDATLWPLYDGEDEFQVVVRPHAGAVAAENPEYEGTCVLLEYQPLSGDVGSLSETNVTFPVNGSISRDTGEA